MDKMYQTLEFEINNNIITIWLNRPQVHNAFNNTMLEELVDILTAVSSDQMIRVVIFTGRGKSFSAGADLNWMKEMIDYTYEENLQDFKVSD